MTHLNFILAAYVTAFICFFGIALRTTLMYRKTSKRLKLMMNKKHAS